MPEQSKANILLRRLMIAGAPLALAVVILGAYVRLRDAGLGCPDWPGCYGQLIGVPDADSSGAPIESAKAWIEVSHRYLAGILGLLVLFATCVAWFGQVNRAQKTLVTALLALVIFQAILGALTVTELLKPIIVTSHLLGGIGILCVLAAYAARTGAIAGFRVAARPKPAVLLLVAGIVLSFQVTLGGWVSTNYAGLACGTNLVTCQGKLLPPADASAFALDRELSKDESGKPLTQRALAAVHWAHRAGAAMTSLVLVALAATLWRRQKTQAIALLIVLSLQLGIGMHIVATGLPLFSSLMHNAGAALLCVTVAAIAAAPQAVRAS